MRKKQKQREKSCCSVLLSYFHILLPSIVLNYSIFYQDNSISMFCNFRIICNDYISSSFEIQTHDCLKDFGSFFGVKVSSGLILKKDRRVVNKFTSRTWPWVGLSRQPIKFTRVLSSESDGPIVARNSPLLILRLTSEKTGSSKFPSTPLFLTLGTSTIGSLSSGKLLLLITTSPLSKSLKYDR